MMRVCNLFSLAVLILMFAISSVFSADLVRVLPVTNKILQLTFDEGHIDYFTSYEDRYNGNKIYYSALDVAAAMDTSGYQVFGHSEAGTMQPVTIGRKAKGVHFNNLYDQNEPTHLKHHWVYLELPQPMHAESTYTVSLDGFAANVNRYTLTYDYKTLRSPAIHVNQIGYVPDATKYAYLSNFMGDFSHSPHVNGALDLSEFEGKSFHIIRTEDHEIVFTGIIQFRKSKETIEFNAEKGFEHANSSLTDVWQCDFTDFDTPGRYRVAIPDMGCSYPFEIDRDIYREPFYATTRAMFYQRQGIIQEIEPGFNYPRDHRTEDGIRMYFYPELSDHGDPDTSTAMGQIKGVWGWYHDAGDWDGYPSHYRVPMTLLALYDLKPENFADGDISQTYKESAAGDWIREGENGLPDVLDEAMWLIKFYKRAKDSLIAYGYSDGGVPGYVGVDAGDGEKPSWADKRPLALKGGEMVLMTYRYAAAAGWLACCLEPADPDSVYRDSTDWRAEAIYAYDWAQNQGLDAEDDVNQAKMQAAAALYRLTADSAYQADFRQSVDRNDRFGNSSLWFNIQPWHFAATVFAMIPDDHPNLDLSLKQDCIDALIRRADVEMVNTAANRAFRYGVDENILFMLGTFSTPRIFLPAAAYEFTGEQKYLNVCYSTCDYTLGGNQMDLVKISGVGDYSEPQPFHIDSWALIDYNSMVYTNPILPGFVPYEMHRSGDWQQGNQGNIGNGWSWVGDEDFSRSTAYPHISNFPDAEARFYNRNSIAGSEWTVHQTLCQAIFAYGYLCGEQSGGTIPNQRPTVTLNLQAGITVPVDSTLNLTVQTSDDVERVEYYFSWHYMGESSNKEEQFKFEWNLSDYNVSPGSWLITVKAFDDKGKICKPEEGVSSRIQLVESSSSVDDKAGLPKSFHMGQNYPNPFNPRTTIAYELPVASDVELCVYDVSGRKIQSLVDSYKSPGRYRAIWDTQELASGVYFYQLKTDEFSDIKKCLFVK
ncbi:MAG: glycoside hydrolase family 9 protein [candidate division KSB1 bacterium]|nr:glycoside hydrolase family 9 protein [candidate division KSB1 bacterium]